MKIGTKIRQAGRCFAGCREGKTVTARKYNEPAPEIVWCAQLPALVMVVVIKRWSVKNGK